MSKIFFKKSLDKNIPYSWLNKFINRMGEPAWNRKIWKVYLKMVPILERCVHLLIRLIYRRSLIFANITENTYSQRNNVEKEIWN